MEMEAFVPVTVVRLTRSRNADGGLVVRLGVPLLDEYLEFLAGRCRPNTVLAVASSRPVQPALDRGRLAGDGDRQRDAG